MKEDPLTILNLKDKIIDMPVFARRVIEDNFWDLVKWNDCQPITVAADALETTPPLLAANQIKK